MGTTKLNQVGEDSGVMKKRLLQVDSARQARRMEPEIVCM